MSVVQLKHLISPQLCVPVAEQKLLILGKPLQGTVKVKFIVHIACNTA